MVAEADADGARVVLHALEQVVEIRAKGRVSGRENDANVTDLNIAKRRFQRGGEER
jgi:predicted transcriptional regulator YheO